MSFITGVHIKQWACLSPFLHFGYFIIPLPHSTLLSHISPASKLIDVLKTQILRFHAMFLYVYYVYLYFLNACRIVDLCREVFSYLKGVQPNATPFPFSRVTINQLLLFYLSFIPPQNKAVWLMGKLSFQMGHHNEVGGWKKCAFGADVCLDYKTDLNDWMWLCLIKKLSTCRSGHFFCFHLI